MQVVDEMQEEEVEEMLEEVEEMQVVAIRQSSRRRCGQVVLSLRPRHLPNSLRSQCRCKTTFQCNNFLVLKFGFCGIHTSTQLRNIQFCRILVNYLEVHLWRTHRISLSCILGIAFGRVKKLSVLASGRHMRLLVPTISPAAPSTFLPQNCKPGNFHPDHKHIFSLGRLA